MGGVDGLGPFRVSGIWGYDVDIKLGSHLARKLS